MEGNPEGLDPESRRLWQAYRACPSIEHRNALIERYAPLLMQVAQRLSIGFRGSQDAGDLVGYGSFGLMEAIERFDWERGIRFEVYALPRIKGAMLDGLRRQDPVPPSWRQWARELEEAYASLEQALGRPAGEEEIAEHLHIAVAELRRREAEVGRASVVSLEEVLFENVERGDLLPSGEEGPEELFLHQEVRQRLATAVERLPEKEQLVVALFYQEGLTRQEIAQVLDLTPARISQLHHKAILRLRGALGREKRNLVT